MTLSRSSYQKKRINDSEILQSDLNIEQKTRSNPLAWNGQFSPQLVELFLKKYTTKDSRVFDPFLGSGTVLLESGRQGISAIGTEINPAGVALATLYELINITPTVRHNFIDSIDGLLGNTYGDLLFQNINNEANDGRQQILGMFQSIENLFQQRLLEVLITLLDFSKADFSPTRVLSIWSKVKNTVLELPFSEKPIQVFHADARSVPLPDNSVDLVITSPPYIN